MDFKAFLKSKQISSSTIASIYGRGSLTDYQRGWLIIANRINSGSGIRINIYRRGTGDLIDSWEGVLSPYFRKMFNRFHH